MEIKKIEGSEFGLEETKAQQISNQFKPMLDKMVELEKEANEVFKMDVESKETSKAAKELRQKYVKVRTGTAAIHKEQKSFYLKAGRFVDGWKNAQLLAGDGVEKRLLEVEKHFENKEMEARNKLKEERIALLKDYEVENVESLGLSLMSEDIFANFLEGAKVAHKNKKDAEAIAIQKEKDEALKVELYESRKSALIPFWNFLKGDTISVDFSELPQESFDIILNEAKEAKESKDLEDQKIKDKLDQETKEKEALKKELEDKKAAEDKAKADELKAAEDELKKGDAAKIQDLINDLESLKTKFEFKSAANKAKFNDVCGLIDKVVDHVKK